MIIKYYGVRGSLPTPGKETIKYGGNTTCLSIRVGGRQYIVDGGSGLRLLGNDLMSQAFGKGKGEAVFFWTHYHWDHLQGFPFFVPNFIPGNQFTHYGPPRLAEILKRQQEFITFPVEFDKMPSRHIFKETKPGQSISVDSLMVTSCAMSHPGGGNMYRFAQGNRSFVLATDFEHSENGWNQDVLKLCQGANLLIFDAQYTPEEYAQGRKTWGHSTWVKGIELAQAAGVRRLHFFHHDQMHSDRFLERKILAPARKIFPRTELAREGWEVAI